jgi:CHU_C Type IX secretion signal domain/PKD domain
MRLSILFLLVSLNAFSQGDAGLRFTQNKGQWNEGIDYQAPVPGGRVGVSATGFSILLLDMEAMERQHLWGHEGVNESNGEPTVEPLAAHYFQISFLGSNHQAKAIVGKSLDGYNNYFLGNDSCRWATNALAFPSIHYLNIYDGIDLRVSSMGNNLKYDFIARPGADPSQIKIDYCGVDGIEKLDGDLEIRTTVGTLREVKPFSYQPDGDDRRTVPSEYRLDHSTASFSFPEGYDDCRTLVIDPLLIFSTYSGSTADNWGSTATPGEHGTLYSAGVTRQDLGGFFPATVGAFQTNNRGRFDMAIIKYDSAGTKFLYATHLGGVNNDSPQSLVVDKTSGDLILLGISSSPDYPTGANSFDKTFNFGTPIFNRVLFTEDDQWDIVTTRLSPDGDKLVGSTFLGGSGNDGLNFPKQSGGPLVVNYGDEMRGDVITDESGHVYISSVTSSSNFPIVNGFDNSFNGGVTDALVVKMTPDLSSILWSSYVGGSGFDAAYSIKFDNDENLVLAGGTTSTNFPATVGSYQTVFKGIVDGWIARLAFDGSAIINATFTGTISFDQVYFVDLNASGDVFCYGQTAGQMPITAGAYKNVNTGQFLQKFSPDLSTLVFSTVFGSAHSTGLVIPNISPTAFLVNDCDNIYMAGWGGAINSSPSTGYWQSTTHGMPITPDAYQKTTSGSDFYFIVLNGDATKLVYSTYLGGNSSKTHVDGGTSRFDKYGIVYHAVCSGCVSDNAEGRATSDFPTTSNAKSRLNLSSNCNNAAFKFDLSSLTALFETNSLDLTMPGFNNVCYPDTIVFQNLSTGGKSIVWDFDDGTIVSQQDTDEKLLIHQYQQSGEYQVKLKITDLSTCSQTDSTLMVINYFKDNIKFGEGGIICEGNGFQLTASGGVSYTWTSSDGTFSSSQQSPIIKPSNTTSYFVTVADGNNCVRKDTIKITVVDSVDMKWAYRLQGSCADRPSVLVQNLTTPADDVTFSFDFGDGEISQEAAVEHVYERDSLYLLKFIAQKEFCSFEESVQLPIFTLAIPNIFTPDVSPGYNDNFEIRFGPKVIAPNKFDLTLQLTVVNRWGKKVFESRDYKNDWSAQGVEGGVYFIHLKVGDVATCRNWLQIVK